MEIIDELEKHKRGPYAGCVGYFSADGQMDTCIVLRTALVKDGVMHIQAGRRGSSTTRFPRTSSRSASIRPRRLFVRRRKRFASRGRYRGLLNAETVALSPERRRGRLFR